MKTSLILSLSLLFLAGCGRQDPETGGGGHSAPGHAHAAPHGGALVMLGDHRYQLEFAPASEGDAMLLYVLDGHASNFVRIEQPAVEVDVVREGERHTLRFEAVADSATGETVGDTSHFRALAPFPTQGIRFSARIREIQVRGTKYTNEAFPYPEGRH